jgi:hypothetical protein
MYIKMIISAKSKVAIRSIEQYSDLIGNRTRDLLACSIVPQPTALPHAPVILQDYYKIVQLQIFYFFKSN